MENKGKRKQPEGEVAATGGTPTKATRAAGGDVARGAPSQEYMTDSQFLLSLIHTPCDQLRLPNNTVYVAERTDKLMDVFRGMIRNNILSVPVLQKTKRKWYGFIDMADIVSYVVELFGAARLQSSEDYWALFEKEETFRTKTVKDVITYPLNRRNPFHPIKTGYSLFTIFEVLGRERDLHRVPIIDEERQLMNVITQSQLITFLYNNLNKIGSKLNKPVRLVKDAIKDVIMISEAQPAIEAFSLMIKENVSGIAVVDEAAKLKGALSLRDLKGVAPDVSLFWRLYQPTRDFLLRLNREHGASRPKSPQFVHSNDTLETVINKLAEHSIHRLFVVDDVNKPIGVISLKEVLFEIIS